MSIKFVYTASFIENIERTISMERLTRYLAATNQDMVSALELYEHNMSVSEALFGLLHGLEVTIRNSIHFTLTAGLDTMTWYDGRIALPWSKTGDALTFSKTMTDMISDAKDSAGGTTASPGKIIAEFTFGFWPGLVTRAFHNALWVPCLHKAFPNTKAHRKVIHRRLETIRWLRNRIAHHEPILTSRNKVYTGFIEQPYMALADVLECVEWASGDAALWLQARPRYQEASNLLEGISKMGLSL